MVALAVFGATIAAVGCFLIRGRSRVLGRLQRQVVVVTLKSGAAFRGVLFESDHAAFVLRDATAMVPNAGPVVVDGEVLILRPDIAYVQRP